jgi:hypothetical protein
MNVSREQLYKMLSFFYIELISRYATTLTTRETALIFRSARADTLTGLTSVFDCGIDNESWISRVARRDANTRAFANTEIFHRAPPVNRHIKDESGLSLAAPLTPLREFRRSIN